MLSVSSDQIEDRNAAAEEGRAALAYLGEAFAEATLDGIEESCFAQAALFTAFETLVRQFGEDPVATYAESLADRVRQGEFTVGQKH